MRCTLYSNDGPLMGEGTCEIADGAIIMTSEEWHTTPQAGGKPLSVVLEDGTQYVVQVDGVHIIESGPGGHLEKYRFTPLEGVTGDEMSGARTDQPLVP